MQPQIMEWRHAGDAMTHHQQSVTNNGVETFSRYQPVSPDTTQPQHTHIPTHSKKMSHNQLYVQKKMAHHQQPKKVPPRNK